MHIGIRGVLRGMLLARGRLEARLLLTSGAATALLLLGVQAPAAYAQSASDLCIQGGGAAECTAVRQGDPVFVADVLPGGFASQEELMNAIEDWGAGYCSFLPTLPSWNSPSVSSTYAQFSGVVQYSGTSVSGVCGVDPEYPISGTINVTKSIPASCPQGYSPGGQSLSGEYPLGYCYRPHVESCPSCSAPNVGNPVSVVDGAKIQAELDYASPMGGLLRFERVYNSYSMTYDGQSLESITGAIGRSWVHNYERILTVLSSGSYVRLIRPDGRRRWFELVSGVYQGFSTTYDRLSTHSFPGGGTGWRYVDANDNVELYNSAGKLVSITARSGQSVTLTYSTNATPSSVAPFAGLLIQVADSFGRQIGFTYHPWGQIATMTDPAGEVYEYAYDDVRENKDNSLNSVTYPDGAVRSYSYAAGNNSQNVFENALVGVSENATPFASYNYNPQGQAIFSSHSGGANEVTLSSYYYSSGSGQVYTTDALGASRLHLFELVNGSLKATTVYQPLANGWGSASSTLAYDTNGNVISKTDFNGIETILGYNTARNLEVSRTEAYGTAHARTTTTNWHSTYRVPIEIVEPNRTTTFEYDSSGNLVERTLIDTSVTPNVARTWTYTYNGYGQVLTEDGPRTDVSDVTTYTYYTCTTGDECGQVETITNALSQTTTFNSYNAHGQSLQITDSNGVVTTLTYDLRQRLTSRTTAGETTTFTYWPTGLLKKATLPDASYLEYSYDNAHRLVQIEDDEGNRIEYTLDAIGNRTAEAVYDDSNALARTRTQVFNSLNQLWKQIGSAGTSAVTTVFGYDDNGNQTSIAAPLSRSTAQEYDPLNRLIEITDPASGTTAFAYDANDNLTSVTDPRSLVTSYAHNGFGDPVEIESPDTGTSTHTYDSGGNLATRTDARSKTGTYAYDALNRVTSITYPDQTLSFIYDAGTYGDGHLTGASDANHSLAWTYDARGRVTGKGQTVGGITQSVGYGYTDGNLTAVTTPSGQTITYGYTGGRISSVTLNGSTTILSNVLYEPFGPVRGWTWGNSTLAERTHNQDGLVTAIDSAGATSYTYDDAFRLTDIDDLDDSSRTWSYGYDALDRLDYGAKSGLTVGYTYDANGNRLSQSGTQTTTYTVSGSSNRLSSITGTPAQTYSYDAAGNTAGYGTFTFAYNDAGRMTSATSGGSTTSYLYNALGQRVKKSNSSITRHFVYDEAGRLVGEYDGSGNLIQETVWLGDIPVATLRPSGSVVSLFYVHTDHLNTPKRISRPSDNVVVWRWDAEPFGKTAANEDPDSDSVNFPYNARFPGQYYDNETGLHYNMARDYDAPSGRYVQSDPIGLKGGVNTYSYVNGQPTMLVDPKGENPVAAVVTFCELYPAACAAAAAAVVTAVIPKPTATTTAVTQNCPDDDECNHLNQKVQRAKSRAGALGKCQGGMSKFQLTQRYNAWLELATARAIRDQKCWNGGDEGHQGSQAAAWTNVGNCGNLLGR